MNYFFVDYENVKNQGLEGVDRLESTDTVIVFYSQNANTMTIDTHHSLCRSKADIRFERVNVGPKNALDFQLATYLGYVIGKTNDYSSKYFLVTKDAGFGVIGKFWRKESVDFTVIGKIADAFAQNKILELKKAENEVFIDDILPLDKQTVIENEEESFEETAEEVTAEEIITQESEIIAETAETEAAATEENAAEEQPVQKNEQSETMESRLFEVLQNESDVAAVVKIVGSYKTKSGINNAIVKSYHTQSGEIYKAIKPYIKDKKGSEPKNAEPELKSELAAALEDVLTNPRQIDMVEAIIKKHKTKTGINSALSKAFISANNKQATEIYRAIKPFIKDKKGSDQDDLELKMEAILPDKTEIPVVVKIVRQYKTKQGINNALMKQFPSANNKKAGEIYQAIKPLLTDKKGQ